MEVEEEEEGEEEDEEDEEEDKSVWRSSNVILFGLNEGQASPTRHPFNMILENRLDLDLRPDLTWIFVPTSKRNLA